MSEIWYEAARAHFGHESEMDEEVDIEMELHELAARGDVEALERLRRELSPIDYAELGWGD
jgi:hypothetical protein